MPLGAAAYPRNKRRGQRRGEEFAARQRRFAGAPTMVRHLLQFTAEVISAGGRSIRLLKRGIIMLRSFGHLTIAAMLAAGSAACSQTARGVVEDTKDNASAVRGGLETIDVKSAILADDTIDADAIDVDTYQDKRLVVLRGSVPTQEQKARAERIARENAKGYTVDNRLAVVP
jgi:hypothetical protein